MITDSDHSDHEEFDDADSSFHPPDESYSSTNASDMITTFVQDDDHAHSCDSIMKIATPFSIAPESPIP